MGPLRGRRRLLVLRPYAQDAVGKRRKDLPAPNAEDDADLAAAERKRFAELKKAVRAIAADENRRLEAAMVSQRSWSAAEFRTYFVDHPVIWHLTRRLVWRCDVDGTTTTFRVAEDRTFADSADDAWTPPPSAEIRIAHPLDLGTREVGVWNDIFGDYEIVQPWCDIRCGLGSPQPTRTRAWPRRRPRVPGSRVRRGAVRSVRQADAPEFVGEPDDAAAPSRAL